METGLDGSPRQPFFRAELLPLCFPAWLCVSCLVSVSSWRTGRPGPAVRGRWDVLGRHCHSTRPQRTAAVTSGAADLLDLSERPLIGTRCQTEQDPPEISRWFGPKPPKQGDAGGSTWAPKPLPVVPPSLCPGSEPAGRYMRGSLQASDVQNLSDRSRTQQASSTAFTPSCFSTEE